MLNNNSDFGFTFSTSKNSLMALQFFCSHSLVSKRFRRKNSLVTVAAYRPRGIVSIRSTLHLIPIVMRRFFRSVAFFIHLSSSVYILYRSPSPRKIRSVHSFDLLLFWCHGRKKNTRNTFSVSSSASTSLHIELRVRLWIFFCPFVSFQHFIVIIATNSNQKSHSYRSEYNGFWIFIEVSGWMTR